MHKGRTVPAGGPPLPKETKPGAWSLHGAHGTVALPECGLVVGRSRLCDLVLPDPDVSRRHLRLSLVQDEPWAIDLGSANGLMVDGMDSRRTRLHDGARIWLGGTALEVRREPAPLPAALEEAWARLKDSPAEALRDLAGAVSCSLEPNHSYALQWESNTGWDDLGPLRRALLETALRWLGAG